MHENDACYMYTVFRRWKHFMIIASGKLQACRYCVYLRQATTALDFDTSLSITTLIPQSPFPSRPLLTLPWLPNTSFSPLFLLLPFPSFPISTFLPTLPNSSYICLNMPIQLLYRPALHWTISTALYPASSCIAFQLCYLAATTPMTLC